MWSLAVDFDPGLLNDDPHPPIAVVAPLRLFPFELNERNCSRHANVGGRALQVHMDSAELAEARSRAFW